MVSSDQSGQWSPASWPISFRWRLLAAVLVLVATIVSVAVLSGGSSATSEVPVVAASQRWTNGRPHGEYVTVTVPADLSVFFVSPEELDGTVTTVDVPKGTLISPSMLRPGQAADLERPTTLMRFEVSRDMWPDPGPAPGNLAVFASSPGGCADAVVPLAGAEIDGSTDREIVKAGPELAALLSNQQWWIWESPPAGWPQCQKPAEVLATCPTGSPDCVLETEG